MLILWKGQYRPLAEVRADPDYITTQRMFLTSLKEYVERVIEFGAIQDAAEDITRDS